MTVNFVLPAGAVIVNAKTTPRYIIDTKPVYIEPVDDGKKDRMLYTHSVIVYLEVRLMVALPGESGFKEYVFQQPLDNQTS